MGMSTPPDSGALKTQLEALLALSQEFESGDSFELEEFSRFVARREVLLEGIRKFSPEAMSGELRELLEHLQEVDERLMHRLDRERDEQARELREVTQVKTVLGAYKFPSVDTSSGVENQG